MSLAAPLDEGRPGPEPAVPGVHPTSLVESAQSIVWRIDTRTLQVTFISRDVEALLGFPCDRWKEPGFWPSRIHPGDRSRTVELMTRVAAGDSVPDLEYRVVAADGRTVWLRTVARLTGIPGEMLGVTFDQTSRRRADALLAGDLKILQMIAAGAPLPEVLQTLVRVVEEQADGMIGSILLLEDGVRVRHAASVNLPAAFVQAIDGLEIGPDRGSCGTAAYRGETVIVEDIATDPLWAPYRGFTLDLGLRACWSVPIKAHEGSVLGTFALYYSQPRRPSPELLELARHASHLAAVAIERHRRIEALRVSEEHLSLVYRHVDDVLFHLKVEPDGDYRFVSVNPAFCRSTGVEPGQVIGKSVREVIPEPSLSLVLRNYEKAIRTNRTVRWEEVTSYPTGNRYGDVAITPVFDSGGRPAFLVGSVRDFTEQKKLEEDNRQLQKLDAIGRLTGGVAHDFNNLLTVILGYGELLLGRFRDDASPRGDLQEIVNAGRRAAALTRQLLAFARKQTLQPQRIQLNVLVLGLEKMLRRLIRENITFEMVLPPDLWPVMADPGQVDQVIVNLAVNARDAIAEAGRVTFETANVELDADYARSHPGVVPGPHVMLALSDTGCGMDETTRKRIFEPFFTTKERGKGTGLGLATVYGIVKQSGGHILLHTEPGKGTTFKIFLPRAGDKQEETKVRTEAPARQAGGEKILVVEDESALRVLCERMLGGLKYTVTVAGHGEEAAAAVEKRGLKPDLLLTDLVMPGMGGRELADRLRQGNPGLKVVYMSGYTDKAMGDPGVLGPGDHFLQKPFTVAALATAVRKALETIV
jgi:PAS domain S-box-containing protein